MSIAPGKKRYALALKISTVERFQSLCREFGLPPNTMSNAVDDFLLEMCGIFEEAKQRGTMSLGDIFRLMGNQAAQLFEEEVKQSDSLRQERDKDTKK